MSEIPSVTLAQKVGLIDGSFLVKRTSGEIEQGWRVDELRAIPSPDGDQEPKSVVKIVRPGSRPLEKTLLLEELQSWQPAPELDEDTIPRENLKKFGGGVVEQVTDHVVTGSNDLSLSEDEFQPNPRRVADIAERVGLTSEAGIDDIERRVREQLDIIRPVFDSLHRFGETGPRASGEIHATLASGRNALTGSTRQALNEYLHGEFAVLERLAADDQQVKVLPPRLMRTIDIMRQELGQFREYTEMMMGRDMPQGMIGTFDDSTAPMVLRTLTDMEQLRHEATATLTETEDYLTQLVGFRQVDEEYKARQEAKKVTSSPFDVAKRGQRTSSGAIRVDEKLGIELEASLSDVLLDKPTEEQIKNGAKHVRELVADQQTDAELRSMSFTDESILLDDRMEKIEHTVWLKTPLFVNPEKIVGAATFGSWMGRGYQGTGMVAHRERMSVTRHSIDQIVDYASRETPIPPLSADGGMIFIQAKNGMFAFSRNAHRAAAAKLRHEPLGTTSVSLYKFDGNLN